VAEIYRHFGWVFDDETRARTERWQARQPAQHQPARSQATQHQPAQHQAAQHQAAQHQAARGHAEPGGRHSLARYGLTGPQVDEAFARYAEFARANKVRLE
jgi:hypothetical protein